MLRRALRFEDSEQNLSRFLFWMKGTGAEQEFLGLHKQHPDAMCRLLCPLEGFLH